MEVVVREITVDEGDDARVCIVIRDGVLDVDVTVYLSTMSGSATGIYILAPDFRMC